MREMKRFFTMLHIAFVFTSEASGSPCLTDSNVVKEDGECWIAMSPVERTSLLRGMWAGIAIKEQALELVGEEQNTFSTPDLLSIPESTTIADISIYLDTLYEKPANLKIGWKYAYLLAAMNARDDDENDAKQLVRLLREKGSLPTRSQVLRSLSADTIEVKEGSQIFQVHLAGVIAAGVPNDIKSRAEDILRALSTTGLGCGIDPSGNAVHFTIRMAMAKSMR
jgi:hypothetical protein